MGQWIEKYANPIALIITTITIVVSLMPARSIPSSGLINIPHLDKIGHLVMYTAMGFVWANALKQQKYFMVKSLFLVFCIGIFLEIQQFYFLEGRFFEIFDIIANISGSLFGLGIFCLLYSK